MHVLHIDSEKDVDKIDKFVKQGSNVFILVYMVGCVPCEATRPEWEQLEGTLKDQYANNNKLVIIDVNKNLLPKIKTIGPIDGFPTIKYIGNGGKLIEPYEKSEIKNKDRSVSSFINWIESKINNVVSTTPTSSPQHVYNRIAKSQKHFSKRNNRRPRNNKNKRSRNNKNKRSRNNRSSRKYKR